MWWATARDLQPLSSKLDVVLGTLNYLSRRMETLMTAVRVQQEDLDALDEALDEATAKLSDKLDQLAAAGTIPEGDLSELKADVEALRNLAAPTPEAGDDDSGGDEPYVDHR